MDFFWIWESISNMFTSATEQIYPVLNDMDNLMYWIAFNPFEIFNGLYVLIWLIIWFSVILFWIAHIAMNLNRYSNKTTLKKSILIISFLIIIITLLLKIPWDTNYKPFDLSLIYLYWDSKDDWWNIDNLKKWYEFRTKKSEFANPFREAWTTANQFLYINIKDIFADSVDKLAPSYQNDEEKNYKTFIVWINEMFSKYGNVWITDSFISNIDLYNLNITEEVKNVSKENFDANWFNAFINTIKWYYDDDKNKSNIITAKTDTEWKLEEPILYKWEKYKFVWSKNNGARTDILLSSVEKKDDVYKYILLPYYDIIYILSNGESKWDITALLDSGVKVDTSSASKIPNDAKMLYNQTYDKLIKLFPNEFKNINENDKLKDNDFVNSWVTWTAIVLPNTNIDKIEYIYKYNKVVKNSNLFDTTIIVNDTKAKLDRIVKNLELLKTSNQFYDNLLTASDASTDEWKKKIADASILLENLKNSIYNEYWNLWKTEIATGVVWTINRMQALNLDSVAIAKTQQAFQTLWSSWDKYDRIKVQQTNVLSLITNLDDKTIFESTDRTLIDILKSIQVVDDKSTELEIINKQWIVLNTLLEFVKLNSSFAFSLPVEENLLKSVCINGDYSENIKWLNNNLNLWLNNTIIDCTLNNNTWKIVDKEKFKELVYKIISLYKAKDLKEEVNLIPYFAILKSANQVNANIFYDSFAKNEWWDAFMTEKVDFWNISFISPLLYYKYLLNQKVDKIPWIFINLEHIDGKVFTAAWVYNMKLWSKNSWYKELDSINWTKYANTLTLWIPYIHNIILWFLWFMNQLLASWIFILLFSIYLILLKSE